MTLYESIARKIKSRTWRRHAHAAEPAHHYSEALAVTDSSRSVHYSLMAGQRALVAYAYQEALSHFKRGMQAKGVPLEGTEPVSDAEEATLLLGLGRSQLATIERREFPAAIGNLTKAFDFYAKVGEVSQAVAVAETPLPTASGPLVGAANLTEWALELVSPDSREAGQQQAVSQPKDSKRATTSGRKICFSKQ